MKLPPKVGETYWQEATLNRYSLVNYIFIGIGSSTQPKKKKKKKQVHWNRFRDPNKFFLVPAGDIQDLY